MDRQTEKLKERQENGKIYRNMERKTEIQKDRQIYRKKDRNMERKTEIWKDRRIEKLSQSENKSGLLSLFMAVFNKA